MDSARQATPPGKESDSTAMAARFRKAAGETPLRSGVAFAAYSLYKIVIGPLLHSVGGVGLGCRYPQTCSEYAAVSILEHGVLDGSCRALARVCSCNPWTEPKAHLMVARPKEAVS